MSRGAEWGLLATTCAAARYTLYCGYLVACACCRAAQAATLLEHRSSSNADRVSALGSAARSAMSTFSWVVTALCQDEASAREL